MKTNKDLKRIRMWISFFMVSLFLSGLTAIPVDAELSYVLRFIPAGTELDTWLNKVLTAYRETENKYPFLLYGYDWLAFAHFVLAVLFIGPLRDPVKNIWVIEFGMIACVLILPYAFIAGHFRNIPLGWRLTDCAFGLVGLVPMWICYAATHRLIRKQGDQYPPSSALEPVFHSVLTKNKYQ